MIPLAIRIILKRALRVYGGKDSERALAWVNAQPVDGPTEVEIKVIRLIAEGLTNREIASSLEISEVTVRTHLHRIYSKLGVTNRVLLTKWAIKNAYVVIPVQPDEDEEE